MSQQIQISIWITYHVFCVVEQVTLETRLIFSRCSEIAVVNLKKTNRKKDEVGGIDISCDWGCLRIVCNKHSNHTREHLSDSVVHDKEGKPQ